MFSVVPIRLAGLRAGRHVFLLWRRRLSLRQVIAWFHVAFREFLTGILSGAFNFTLYRGHGDC
jgi:hypothetical protein